MAPSGATPVDLLLVEDNPADVRLIREAFEHCNVRPRLQVVGDGEEAIAFFHREGVYADAEHPDVIILDLNLPRKDGKAVLSEIRADPALRRTPVIVLTTSDSERDVVGTYELAANCCLRKSDDLDEFFNAIRLIGEFWFTAVQLPPKATP